jgi:ribonuclease T1
MSYLTSRAAKVLLASLLAVLGTLGLTATATAAPQLAGHASQVTSYQADCGDTSGFDVVALSSLPPEATDTVNLIQQGGPFPYSQDGTVFSNREGVLPDCSYGYYHEYTVITPGSSTRGARRIITGDGGEYFYTDDHYATFSLVDINS